ncbi:MAG TPA: hypothetical protein VLT36_09490 [Candidatus Dormibacteraeota bacterium]|nr:hypothetical protein [Candidatus Dormibacteraeota bacterium]
MTRLPAILMLVLGWVAGGRLALGQSNQVAQPSQEWTVTPLNPDDPNDYVEADLDTGIAHGTNGVMFRIGGVVVTANSMTVDGKQGELSAEGSVRIQREEQLWVGEQVRYNYNTHQMEAEQFRTGKTPTFVEGEGLAADVSGRNYTGTNAVITTEDVAHPMMKVRAKSIKIIEGKRIEARHATLYVAGVPIFYFPYYSRELGPQSNDFNFVPGYRSSYGPFLLSSYRWFLNPELDGTLHLDLRERRGVGLGPDVNYHLGPWGDGTVRYYYIHDLDPNAQLTNSIPKDRQRVWFSYLANPYTNFDVRSMVRYQKDIGIVHDFFEAEYRHNPQPSTFVEANKYWQNFSLDAYVQPRVNNFYDTVERLPDVRLTGWRQQIGTTPLYYESETSAGYYRRLFAETNGPALQQPYEAARADTFHQLLLPLTFFGWLNLTPKVGGRFTYYSEASGPGATTDEVNRGVFNTGAEMTFKASRVWPGIQNKTFEMDGMRHIFQPYMDYVFVPSPNYAGTNSIPQFDYEIPSLRLLPIDFPDYNSIDSIDQQNTLRYGIRNKIQTKRKGEVVDVVNWDVYLDWHLRPRSDQTTFSDLFSDAVFRPRSWLSLESVTRYDIAGTQWRLAFNSLNIHPNDIWSWTFANFYLKGDNLPPPSGFGIGNNLFISSLFFRLNENWGFRASQRFEARDGRLEEQDYTVYRDLRSWTAALTLRLRDNRTGPDDFGVAFSFSLKAFPRFGLGSDTLHPFSLLGT